MRAWFLKFIGSALILVALFWWSDFNDIVARLRAADWQWILASLLALVLTTVSMARRWQLTVRAVGLEMPYSHALREYYLSQFLNSVLPGGVLGDVGRAVRMRQAADLKRAAQLVMAERLIGQLAMFALLALGLGGAIFWPSASESLRKIGIVFCVLLGFGALLTGLALRFSSVRGFVALVQRLLGATEIVAHAIVGAVMLLFSMYACARATGTVIPPEGWLTVLPFVFCAMLVPLSIAGWGWREGAAAALFPVIGLSAAAGVAMGICYGAVVLVSTLPALVLLFLPMASDRGIKEPEPS